MDLDPASDPAAFPRLKSPVSGGEDHRASRLVHAAAQLISERGTEGVSARTVAAAAAVAPSAINYNFGGIEQLFSSAFGHGVALTGEWLEARTAEILALPRAADGLADALEYVVSEWTGSARSLALLYQECLALGPGRGPAAAWTGLWRDHWLRIAAAFGASAVQGRLLHLLFEAEALYHLSAWSPALERAALREMCDQFASVWLGAKRRPGGGALAHAEQTAGARQPGGLAPAALRIAQCAAEVVEAEGLGGLTHRAVAARAGVTTGAVTHHFRTIEHLVAGAIRGQVLAMTQEAAESGGPAPGPIEDLLTAEALFEAMAFHALADRPPGPAVRRRRLFLATVRRAELAGAGAAIRYSHGGTTREALAQLFPVPPQILSLQAGVLSRLLATIWFATAADPSPAQTRAALFAEIRARFADSLGRAS